MMALEPEICVCQLGSALSMAVIATRDGSSVFFQLQYGELVALGTQPGNPIVHPEAGPSRHTHFGVPEDESL